MTAWDGGAKMAIYWKRYEHAVGELISDGSSATPRSDRAGDDALAAWRSAAWRVTEAWEVWRATTGADRHDAHSMYLVALADEEMAAERLRHEAAPRPGC